MESSKWLGNMGENKLMMVATEEESGIFTLRLILHISTS